MSDIKERLRDCNKLWTANEVRFEAADYIEQLEMIKAEAENLGIVFNSPDDFGRIIGINRRAEESEVQLTTLSPEYAELQASLAEECALRLEDGKREAALREENERLKLKLSGTEELSKVWENRARDFAQQLSALQAGVEAVWWHHVENGQDVFLNMPTGLPDETPLYTAAPAIKQQVAEGWKLVPIKLTPEMVEAGANCDPERESPWEAYLAAAPEFPAPTHPVSANQPDGGKVPDIIEFYEANRHQEFFGSQVAEELRHHFESAAAPADSSDDPFLLKSMGVGAYSEEGK